MTLRIGSLFSGAGGLDMAVQAVFDGQVVWHSEIDPAASKVLAHHWPEIPNLGDITEIDWANWKPMLEVDILCGGFPCQDVSAAGKRAGIKDGTRSGLWAIFAEAIDILRPQIVVIENVRGLLSAAAHRTVEEDDESSDMESAAATMGNGAGRPVLRAAGAVLGDLADLRYDARWATVSAASVGAPHRRERVFIVATDTSSDGLQGHDARASVNSACDGRQGNTVQSARSAHPHASNDGVDLLPTPLATDGTDGPVTNCVSVQAICDGSSGRNPRLSEMAAGYLLPTPRSSDCFGAGQHGDGGMDLRTTVTLLPTPAAQDGNGGGRYSSEGHQSTLPGEVRLLPTPKAHDGEFGTPRTSGRPIEKSTRLGTIASLEQTSHWGKYEPAIRRWESLTRPAPAPTEPNKNGNPRLSAAFSEWLMGWPDGWVTDPAIGISRNDQLRIVGNGVCSQQAAAALRYLLQTNQEGV